MIELNGYQISEIIHQGKCFNIYRATRLKDYLPVIIKANTKDIPDVNCCEHLKREFELGSSVSHSNISNYLSLEKFDHRLALVIEDIGGDEIAKIIPPNGFALQPFLNIALQLAQGIGAIHQHQIIHQAISSNHIFISPKSGLVKIGNFSSATQLAQEKQISSCLPKISLSKLAYISPEQTGRMNRKIDYRSDFYSFGIVLYEMLYGHLPFQANDLLDLVYCHITQEPTFYSQQFKVPQIIINIIKKLLAKNAEDRYRSAYGVESDLQLCLSQLSTRGVIEDFAIAQHDFSEQFNVSQKLYGREKEIKQLCSICDDVCLGKTDASLLLVHGYSGVGKSALINEIQKSFQQSRAIFISGKCDQLDRSMPYAAIAQAFKVLINKILIESNERIVEWKSHILNAIGSNARIIIEIIPELELIIGQQPPVAKLSAIENQNRFQQVFYNFIAAIAQPEHPLVLCLDDLQWANSSILNLIQFIILNSGMRYLLCVGAYRDNEVDKNHLLSKMIDSVQCQRKISRIELKPLPCSCIYQLLADTLNAPPSQEMSKLSDLIYEKTQGNPFFTNQFLMNLYQTKQIVFNINTKKWEWNLLTIKNMNVTVNVIDLMLYKIGQLPSQTQKILSLAASIGYKFNIATLAIIYEDSKENTVDALWPAVNAELVLPTDKNYYDAAENVQDYQFLHDRVQQAALELIPLDKLKPLRLKIGRLLLERMPAGLREDKLYYIASQMNDGKELIEDENEKINLAQINLKLAKKAKDSTAYQSALSYAQQGIHLLSSRCWQNNYSLAFDLYKVSAECNYLHGCFAAAEELYPLLLEQAQSIFDKASIYSIKMNQAELQGKYKDAITTMRLALALFGVHLPDDEDQVKIMLAEELQKITANLNNRNIQDLINAPAMVDQKIIMIMRLLHDLWTPCYTSGLHHLSSLVSALMVNYSLCYGNCELSSAAYTGLSVYFGPLTGDYANAYEFGEVGIALANSYENLSLRCRSYLMFGGGTCFWRKPLRSSYYYLDRCYELGIESGNLAGAGYAVHFILFYRFMQGENLSTIYEMSKNYISFLKRSNEPMYNFTMALTRPLRELVDANDGFDDERYLATYQHMNVFEGANYVGKLITAYFLGDIKDQIVYAQKSLETVPIGLKGLFEIVDSAFYAALIYLSAYPSAQAEDKKQYLLRVENIQAQMKTWMDNCPENCSHKYFLIEAEKSRIQQSHIDHVLPLYERAMEAARKHEFIHIEALANELCAKYWLEKNNQEIAMLYLHKASQLYSHWGAVAKVKQLEKHYSQLKMANEHDFKFLESQLLDLTSTMRAAQAISTEINLNKLLIIMIQIIMENAGAKNVSYMVNDEGKLRIEVECNCQEGMSIKAMKAIPLDAWTGGALSIVRYVMRTRKPVLLGMAVNDPQFGKDPFIINNQVKSILCIPVLKKDELEGVLYLDNPLISHAFSENHIKVLSILTSQIAISLKNANLFESMQSATKRLHHALRAANMGTWIWKVSDNTLTWDEQLYTIYGVNKETFSRSFEGFMALVHPDDRAKVEKSVRGALEEDKPHDLQLRIIRPIDKKVITVISRANAFRDEYGQVQGMLGACCDITHIKVLEEERLQALKQLEKKERQRELALKAGNIGTWTWTPSDNKVIPDARLLALYGLKKEEGELSYDEFANIIHPDDRIIVTQALQQAVEKDIPFEVEFRIIRPDDLSVHILAGRAEVYRDAQGRAESMVGLNWDITQRKKLEEERVAALKEAEEKERQRAEESERHRKEQQERTDTGNHELRNPLSVIMNNIDEQKEALNKLREYATLHPDNELAKIITTFKDTVKSIDISAQHQKNVIDRSLSLSLLEAGKMVIVKKIFQPHEIIKETAEMFINQVAKKHLSLNLTLPAKISTVKGDAYQLKSILINLISNAIKYTDKGYIAIALQVQAQAKDTLFITICVEDSGRGMSPEKKLSLFQRFSGQLSSQFKESVGLGLYITKKIIEFMGGTIEVTSEEGKGTTFTVRLPFEQVAPEIIIKPADNQNDNLSSSIPIQPVPKKILVVEDNLLVQKCLKRQLEQAGHQCLVAANGVEALEQYFQNKDIDIILMDKQMPVMDGLAATKEIRCKEKELKLRHVPIIGLSAYDRPEQVEESLAAGMDAYLKKPCEKESLYNTIQLWTTTEQDKPNTSSTACVAQGSQPSSFWHHCSQQDNGASSKEVGSLEVKNPKI